MGQAVLEGSVDLAGREVPAVPKEPAVLAYPEERHAPAALEAATRNGRWPVPVLDRAAAVARSPA